MKLSLEEYIKKLSAMADDQYGQMYRRQFKDVWGTSELAMLQSPTADELEQLRRAVAIMTAKEKEMADSLTDEQAEKIAEDAKVDKGLLALFFNGYSIMCKRVR